MPHDAAMAVMPGIAMPNYVAAHDMMPHDVVPGMAAIVMLRRCRDRRQASLSNQAGSKHGNEFH